MACRIVTARRQQRQQKRNLKSIEEEEDESVKKMYLYYANQPPKSLATTPTPWRWLNQVDVPWIIYEKVCVKARKELHHSLRITYSTAEAKKEKKKSRERSSYCLLRLFRCVGPIGTKLSSKVKQKTGKGKLRTVFAWGCEEGWYAQLFAHLIFRPHVVTSLEMIRTTRNNSSEGCKLWGETHSSIEAVTAQSERANTHTRTLRIESKECIIQELWTTVE